MPINLSSNIRLSETRLQRTSRANLSVQYMHRIIPWEATFSTQNQPREHKNLCHQDCNIEEKSINSSQLSASLNYHAETRVPEDIQKPKRPTKMQKESVFAPTFAPSPARYRTKYHKNLHKIRIQGRKKVSNSSPLPLPRHTMQYSQQRKVMQNNRRKK